jgi:hypothetical protein
MPKHSGGPRDVHATRQIRGEGSGFEEKDTEAIRLVDAFQTKKKVEIEGHGS